MGTITAQGSIATLTPARGLRTFSTPGDPAGFVGVTGIHFNVNLEPVQVLAGLPLAAANNTGASYLSPIHGALGSDPRNPTGAPAAGFNPNRPAFPNPEVTGYYVTPPLSQDVKKNGFINTEKVIRAASDAAAGANNGTLWQETQGRTRLNFALWLLSSDTDKHVIELYQDLNVGDKIAGVFGVGTGPTDPTNALLLQQWTFNPAFVGGTFPATNKPSAATQAPYDLPGGSNLYLLFRSQAGLTTRAVGTIWLS